MNWHRLTGGGEKHTEQCHQAEQNTRDGAQINQHGRDEAHVSNHAFSMLASNVRRTTRFLLLWLRISPCGYVAQDSRNLTTACVLL
jgi:hypothetical protein